jgi:protein CpxP
MDSLKHMLLTLPIVTALLSVPIVSVVAQRGPGDPATAQGQTFSPQRGRGPFGPAGGAGIGLERLGRELAFTDAQQTQIQALLAEQRATLKSSLDALFQARQALDAAVMQVPTDAGLLQTRVTEISTIEAQIMFARAQTEARIFGLLTAEQQAKAQQLLARMQERLSQRAAQAGQ